MDSQDGLDNSGNNSNSFKGRSGAGINLEIANYNSKKVRVNSPRSLEAMGKLGYTLEELSYVSFKDYLIKHPELRALPKDVQKSRYDFLESKRQNKIDLAKQERQKILKEEDNRSDSLERKSGDLGGSKFVTSQESQIGATAINNDLKALERLKKKQEMELLNMVQFELKAKLMQKENEEKMRVQREKELRHKHQVEMHRKAEEEQKRKKELERQEKQKKEEEEQMKRDQERYFLEQKKGKEEMERERLRMREARIKQENEKKKQEEFRLQIEKIINDSQRQAEARQLKLLEKDRERREALEKKRLDQVKLNQQKQVTKQQQIEHNMKNLDEKLAEQRNLYLKKEHQNEEKKHQFETMREMAFKSRKDKNEQRNQEIKKVLEKNQEQEQKKVDEYNKKQQIIQQKKQELEVSQISEHKKKIEKMNERDNHIKATLRNNEDLENQKKEYILTKIKERDDMVQRMQMMKERENMEKSESRVIKRYEKDEALKRLSNIQDFEKSRTLGKIYEKNHRIEEFKQQRGVIADKKRFAHDEVNRKKAEYQAKFDSIFKHKNVDVIVDNL
jgi:hypothetical protein